MKNPVSLRGVDTMRKGSAEGRETEKSGGYAFEGVTFELGLEGEFGLDILYAWTAAIFLRLTLQ